MAASHAKLGSYFNMRKEKQIVSSNWILLKLLIAATLTTVAIPTYASPENNLSRRPLLFETNRGQTDPAYRFMAQGPGFRLFFAKTGITLALETNGQSDVANFTLVGANPLNEAVTDIAGVQQTSTRLNYFIGSDRGKWQRNVPTYRGVRYANVYDGIDVLFRDAQGSLEYDFVVAPGADPSQIVLTMAETQNGQPYPIHLSDDGAAHVSIGESSISMLPPVLYQDIHGQRLSVDGKFVLAENHSLSFEVGDYDTDHELVIDPVLRTSTYLGGFFVDNAADVAIGADGSIYVLGTTTSVDFPVVNAIQGAPASSQDMFVTKYSADATVIEYSTYLGGGANDGGSATLARGGIAVDNEGNVYIASDSTSDDYPVVGGVQSEVGGGVAGFFPDVVVTKLNTAGDSIVYSTYLGGDAEELAFDIDVDSMGAAYITGFVSSVDFPTTEGVFQPTIAETGPAVIGDAFITKLAADGASLVFSTFLGGSELISPRDEGTAIAVDAMGNVFVAGNTRSTDFPLMNPIQSSGDDISSGFVAKLTPTADALLFSTYLAGGDADVLQALALDSAGNAYVTGFTESGNFPTTNTAFQSNINGEEDVFVTKIAADGSALLYSTFLGGADDDSAFSGRMGITVDSANNAWVTGSTLSTDFPLVDPLQEASAGDRDVFVAQLNATGSDLRFSTYLGGEDTDVGGSIAIGPDNLVAVVGTTFSTDFPLVQASQTTTGGLADVFVTTLAQDPADTLIVSAVLPASRIGQVGTSVTAFATILNAGQATAEQCGITPVTSLPLTFTYQTTAPDNTLAGLPNTPVDIPADGGQSFVMSFELNAAFPLSDVVLSFFCANTLDATSSPVNGIELLAQDAPVADVIGLAATLGNDGVVRLDQDGGSNGATLAGAFSVATVNVGTAADEFTVTANTGDMLLVEPVTTFVCQTEPATGACLADPAGSVLVTIAPGDTPTFAFFPGVVGPALSGAPVPFDPTVNRVFVQLEASSGVAVNITSVAVTTETE